MAELSTTRRTRSTPFTSRVETCGVKAYTVYNHMLLPTVFRSVEEDCRHLCEHVQVWDVSCERQVQIKGPDADQLVQWMTPRDISAAQDDQCFYLPLCDEHGKLMNDPVGIKIEPGCWWLSLADSDILLWAKGLATGKNLNVEVTEPEVWPLAIQGPKAETLMQRIFGPQVSDIRFFRYKRLSFQNHEFIVARSGWSKQGGFEVYVDDAKTGQALWDELFSQGQDLQVAAGAPNHIERMESGLLSFGSDMDFSHSPLQCGLDKYCHLDRNLKSLSIAALKKEKAEGVKERLVGIYVAAMPTLPQKVDILFEQQQIGYVTSQCLSLHFDCWLAFAMLDGDFLRRHKPPPELTIATEIGEFQGICTELPFNFSSLQLQQRQETA